MTLKKKKKLKRGKGRWVELNQGQYFCLEVQIKLIEAEFDGKMKQLTMGAIYFYSFKFLVALLCLKRD